MQLVNEQDDAALTLAYFLQHRLEPFLELATVFGPCHQRTHIQGEEGFLLQAVRDVSADNPLCQPLRNGGFTYARFADEHRVILALAGKDTDDVANLVVPANHRIQFLLPRPLHQVGAVFFQGVIGGFRAVSSHTGTAPHRLQNLQKFVFPDAKFSQQSGHCFVRVIQQRYKQVLHRHEFVLHSLGGLFCTSQYPVHLLGNIEAAGLPAGAADAGQSVNFLLHPAIQCIDILVHLLQQLGDQPLILLQQRA